MINCVMARGNAKILFNYRRLRHLKRCNNFPTVSPIDVAQHSYYVTLLAMTFADEYNQFAINDMSERDVQCQSQVKYKLLNTDMVMRKALLHDTAESWTGDIPWNIKHANLETNESITWAIEQHLNMMYENASELFLRYKKWSEESKECAEGELVNIADMVELAMYCFEEFTKGNSWMKPLMEKAVILVDEFLKETEYLEACPTLKEILLILSELDVTTVFKRVEQLIDIR